MGHANDMEKSVRVTKEGEVNHSEFGSPRRESLVAHVKYDEEGIGGIIRSPYVFGAALLASFGGFSFGYGTRIEIPAEVVQTDLCRPGCHLSDPRYAPVS